VPGKAGWAAFAWQVVSSGDANWGKDPGADLSQGGYRSLRFWARGDLSASGGTPPKAQFKSGGNVAPEYAKGKPPVFSVAGPTLELIGWAEYCLDLRNKDLSNVVSPFTVVMTRPANPKGGVVIIDDVVFSPTVCAER
jgi:hypothetical protein